MRKKMRVTRKGGGPKRAKPNFSYELTNLAINLDNLMFKFNQINFNSEYLKLDGENVPGLLERDVNIIGSDNNPVQDAALNAVLMWRRENPDLNAIPPWQDYVGKLCKIPPGFFATDTIPTGYLNNVKNNPTNFNRNFPKDLTNRNIQPIKYNILARANAQGKAVDLEGNPIPKGKYKFVLMENDEIRFFPDTDGHNPYDVYKNVNGKSEDKKKKIIKIVAKLEGKEFKEEKYKNNKKIKITVKDVNILFKTLNIKVNV